MSSNFIFDHDLLATRRKRAMKRQPQGSDFLLDFIEDELLDRLSLIERTFEAPATLHDYGRNPLAKLPNDKIAKAPLKSDFGVSVEGDKTSFNNLDLLPEEMIERDLIVSPLSLHLTNDTPGIFKQIFDALKPDGLFLAATLGAGTLQELRESLLIAESQLYGGASARVAPFADIKDYGGLLQRAGFALPVIDSHMITVRYDDIYALMRDLRQMGMTNPLFERSKKPVNKTFFKIANKQYHEKFSDQDNRIRASFSFVFLSGWKPHKSQQKPLQPGSAKTRLSDALNVNEIKLPK